MNRWIFACLAAGLLMAPTVLPARGQRPAYDLKLRFSNDRSCAVYCPAGWKMTDQAFGNARVVRVASPNSPTQVVFAFFTRLPQMRNSVDLASRYYQGAGTRLSDFKMTRARSAPDRMHTMVDASYSTPTGTRIRSRCYFTFHAPVGVIFGYEAPAADFARLQPLLVTILTNFTALKPEAFRQTAGQAGETRPPLQLQMRQVTAADGTCGMLVPAGWNFVGGGGRGLCTSPDGGAGFAFSVCEFVGPSSIPRFSSAVIPGIHLSYCMPIDALLVLMRRTGSTGHRILWRAPNPRKAQEAAAALRCRADAEVALISSVTRSGIRSRGYYDVLGFRPNLAGQWSILFVGAWAPEAEFGRYLPTLVRMGDSYSVNQAYARSYVQAGMARLRQMQAETSAMVARNAQEIREMNSAAFRERWKSGDYIDYKRSAVIRGEQEWVSEAEGGAVYKSDAWGLSREGQGVAEGQPWNYYNYNGANPHYNEQMTPVDSSREVWERVYGR